MNLRLLALQVYLPPSLKTDGLLDLFQLTADAFGAPMPDVEACSQAEVLLAFATFTRDQAELVPEGDIEAMKLRLYERAYRLGNTMKQLLEIRSSHESLRAARLLYRTLGIDFRANERGDVTIARCYFSRFYTDRSCRILSSLDEGLLAGLSGGGRLCFKTRITEHQRCCLATIDFSETNEETGDRRGHRCRWCNNG